MLKTVEEIKIETHSTKKAALIFRAINHKLRQRILQLIHTSEKITVTEIYTKLKIEQSVASQHLALLRHAGFVITERQERFIFYSVNYKRVQEVQEKASELGVL